MSERIAGTITTGGEVVIGDVTAVPSVAALLGAMSRCSHAALYSAVEVTDYAVVFYQICIVKAHPGCNYSDSRVTFSYAPLLS